MERTRLLAGTLLTGLSLLVNGTPVGAAGALQTSPPRGIVAAYTLVAPKEVAASQLVARVVLPRGAGCPNLRVQVGSATRRLAMAPRNPGVAALPAFASLQVCDRAIPSGARSASILGRSIPAALPARVDSIALAGDSGCRIKGSAVQNCNDPAEWPLARISEQIARDKPDLVAYLGDFLYRESACPASMTALCGGSPAPLPGYPFVDSDYSWLADALVPMAPMLPVAPIVVLRGNHEICERGGNGYFLLFDPRPDTAATCNPVVGHNGALTVPAYAVTPTWAATIPVRAGSGTRNLRMAVADSSYGSDSTVTSWAATQRTSYQQAADLTSPKSKRESWLLTHKPVFSYVTTDYAATNPPSWTVWTSLDQTAASQGLLDNYSMILSSHNHLFQAVQIPGQPASVIVGNGGTSLDPPTGYPVPAYGPLGTPAGAPLQPGIAPYPAPTYGFTSVQFGYVIASPGRASGNWTLSVRDTAGKQVRSCRLATRTIGCG